jgi:hypothetical protein
VKRRLFVSNNHKSYLVNLVDALRGASASLSRVYFIACLMLTFGQLLLIVTQAHAFTTQAKIDKKEHFGIVDIGSEYQNSIKLLNNRFRIDEDIEEITIVLFREYGSAPVVLVRPDGSKLFLDNDHNDNSYNWFETDSYDMISLKNPMPGPWQAVGDILPESRVMVIAGVVLHAQSIPEIVFSGETIKQTARLVNIGSDIDMSLFKDIVSLSIDFVSTNNPDFPNFGLGSRQVAVFQDDGKGFDESLSDGVFTGEFNLEITEGEWRPVFTVRTPLFTREQVNDIVLLRKTPVTISHHEAAKSQNTANIDNQNKTESKRAGDIQADERSHSNDRHEISIDVDANYLNPDNFIVDGTVRHPNGESVKFSMTQVNQNIRKFNINNSGYGIYKINMTVFASTITGRDVVLSVPEYSFVTAAPELQIKPSQTMVEEPEVENAIDAQLVAISAAENAANQESDSKWLWLAVMINAVILVFGSVLIVLLVSKRNHPNNHLALIWKRRFVALLSKSPNAGPNANEGTVNP